MTSATPRGSQTLPRQRGDDHEKNRVEPLRTEGRDEESESAPQRRAGRSGGDRPRHHPEADAERVNETAQATGLKAACAGREGRGARGRHPDASQVDFRSCRALVTCWYRRQSTRRRACARAEGHGSREPSSSMDDGGVRHGRSRTLGHIVALSILRHRGSEVIAVAQMSKSRRRSKNASSLPLRAVRGT